MSNQKQDDSPSPARSPEECGVSEARLVAGRELDALVATKVLGWRWLATANRDGSILISPETVALIDADRRDRLSETPQYEILTNGAPARYSTDIAAAWQVVEKMTRDWIVTMEMDATSCRIEFGQGYADTPRTVHATAYTAPLAICLAALKAVQSPANGEASDTGAQGVQTNGSDSGYLR